MRECPTCLQCFSDQVSDCPSDSQATINSLPGEATLEGRYLLERRLGQGGMGVVYKAHHVFLKSPHAIKVIMPDLVGNDPSVAARFRQEAMAAAAIRHPNIISVTDYGFISGEIPFLVMEFVEGNSLQDVMSNEGVFSPEKALDYIRAIASGVGAAHQHGIVHRDLKPLNIMIQNKGSLRDGIRILDFGLAKIKSGELLGSFVGAKTTGIIGSPYYMAPEQWSDEEPDKRCDIYSLGIILHQMLTGDVPFKGSSIPAVMKKHLMTPPPPLASVTEGISEALERVVHHALEKEPEKRTASAEDLIAELEQAVVGVGVSVGTTTTRVRTRKPKTVPTRAKKKLTTHVTGDQKKVQSGAARITAKQKKAQREEEAAARSTADQNEALQKMQRDTISLRGEMAVSLGQSERGVEAEKTDNIPGGQAEEPTKTEALPGTQVIEEPLGRKVEGYQSQNNDKAIVTRLDEEGHELGLKDQESWRRAAQQARRRAEERALRESGALTGDMLLSARVPSLAPPAPVAVAVPESRPSKTQISFGGLLQKPLVLAGLAALILSAVGVYFLTRARFTSEEIPTNSSTANKPASPRDMAFIKGGTFMMGTENGLPNQRPAHTVTVSSFYMDKTEVTNLQYAAFVKATGHAVPVNDDNNPRTKGYWVTWQGSDPPSGREQWPVCNVSVKDAEAFAQWLSERDGVKYRLPSEQEWEYAARNGHSGSPSRFPWGDSWAPQLANIGGASSPMPVGSFPEGQNPTGLLDMIGNVWEWTSSKASYYDNRPVKDMSANVMRGDSFADEVNRTFSPATDRDWFGDEHHKFPSIGFRLVRDAP